MLRADWIVSSPSFLCTHVRVQQFAQIGCKITAGRIPALSVPHIHPPMPGTQAAATLTFA